MSKRLVAAGRIVGGKAVLRVAPLRNATPIPREALAACTEAHMASHGGNWCPACHLYLQGLMAADAPEPPARHLHSV